jgi:hypothetical protein
MAVEAYIRAFPKAPYDTRTYTTAVSAIFSDAISEIGTGWTKDDVTYIDSGSIITVIITYGTN